MFWSTVEACTLGLYPLLVYPDPDSGADVVTARCLFFLLDWYFLLPIPEGGCDGELLLTSSLCTDGGEGCGTAVLRPWCFLLAFLGLCVVWCLYLFTCVSARVWKRNESYLQKDMQIYSAVVSYKIADRERERGREKEREKRW